MNRQQNSEDTDTIPMREDDEEEDTGVE
jgi:hypothetical protein